MSGTCRRDTIWMPGIWATSLLVMLVVTTNDTLGGGWTEQTPLPAQKQQKPRTLGITTDVTPLKIVGLNNYRRLQGVPTWDAFRRPWKEVSRQVAAKPQGGAGWWGGNCRCVMLTHLNRNMKNMVSAKPPA